MLLMDEVLPEASLPDFALQVMTFLLNGIVQEKIMSAPTSYLPSTYIAFSTSVYFAQ